MIILRCEIERDTVNDRVNAPETTTQTDSNHEVQEVIKINRFRIASNHTLCFVRVLTVVSVCVRFFRSFPR